ncbi:MAG: hypothetical protein F2911_09185 [Actinobacteria bacterium]|nr:hypothetical protein [Actinomycetota bacterium]
MSRTRMRVFVTAVTLVGALGAAASVSAWADTSSSPLSAEPVSAGDPVVFTIGVTQDIDSANPFTGLSSLAYEVFQMQYPLLTQYGAKDFSIVPGIADSWQESADKTTWTYKIHPGLVWSDGQPMTARDAAYTFNRVLTGEYEKTNYGSYIENMTKAEAIDDTTLVLTVSKPSPIMEHLYVYILPRHVWEKIDEKTVTGFSNEGTLESPTVGGGSFYMIERRVGQFIRMKANPTFFRGKPGVDEIDFKIFKNSDALGQALKKGEIDFAEGLEANVFASLKDVPGITAVAAAPAGYDELGFNTGAALADGTAIGDGNPLLRDKALRQALVYAVNREQIVEKVLGGGGLPGSTVIPPLYSAWHLEPSAPASYDPAKARSMLDAAGYTVGADGVRVDSKGKRLSFRLFGRTESATSQKSVQYLKGYLAAVGVEVTVKTVSEDVLTELVGQGNFDMFEWAWGVEPDPNYMLSTFTCANRSYQQDGATYANLSDSFYCNPAYDELFAQQGAETDATKRVALVKQMQQMLYDDAPYVLTYYYDNYEAYRSDKFEGFVHQPQGDGTMLFQWGAWTYESVKPVTATPAPTGSSSAEPVSSGASDQGAASGSGSSSAALTIGLVVVVVVVGGGLILMRRRRGPAVVDDRE